MEHIGKRIRYAREKNEWTQEELAKIMGYKSKTTINKIELGKNDVTQRNIKKFSDVLGVPISYLMGWDEEQINNTAQMQNDANEYHDAIEQKLLDISKLELTLEEMEKVYDYALLIWKARDK